MIMIRESKRETSLLKGQWGKYLNLSLRQLSISLSPPQKKKKTDFVRFWHFYQFPHLWKPILIVFVKWKMIVNVVIWYQYIIYLLNQYSKLVQKDLITLRIHFQGLRWRVWLCREEKVKKFVLSQQFSAKTYKIDTFFWWWGGSDNFLYV